MIDPEALTRRWLQDCVLALDLCPFAAPVLHDEGLRIAVSTASDPVAQLRDFLLELDYLQEHSDVVVATTLLVLADGPTEFPDFLDLVDGAEQLIDEAGLEGIIQLAHFHPAYLFAGEPADDISHYTNRSPLPVLHLLRESMLTRVLASFPDPAGIPGRNTATLRELGREEVKRRWAGLLSP